MSQPRLPWKRKLSSEGTLPLHRVKQSQPNYHEDPQHAFKVSNHIKLTIHTYIYRGYSEGKCELCVEFFVTADVQ